MQIVVLHYDEYQRMFDTLSHFLDFRRFALIFLSLSLFNMRIQFISRTDSGYKIK